MLESFPFATLLFFGEMIVNTLFYPANIHVFKINNRNTRKRCEICSELAVKTPERRNWRCSAVFIVNFEYISLLLLVFLLRTFNKLMLAGYVCKAPFS